MPEALVFSVEEFSIFDGPGIRTSVFLKGCPLRCSWCHNPEGQRFENEVMKQLHGCTACGACKARHGDDRIRACPNHLLRWCAQTYTPMSLVEKLSGNFEILSQAGGGITFSGGEPLAHPEFLAQTLDLLQGRIHTAVQTSGFAAPRVFDTVLQKADYFLYDLKLADSSLHKHYTGAGNEEILRNFTALVESGKEFVVRTPLIPGVTDTEENLAGIAQILRQHGVKSIELLPYHRAAGGKYAAVGKVFSPQYDENRPVTPRIDLFASHGIRAVVL